MRSSWPQGTLGRQDWRLGSEHDLIAINYTSGTTGRPRG